MILTIEIEEGPSTRWVVPGELVADQLQILAQSVARINCTGAVPKVTVTRRPDTTSQCEGCGAKIVAGSQWCPKCGVEPQQ